MSPRLNFGGPERTFLPVLSAKKWDKLEVFSLFLGVFTTVFVAMSVGLAVGKILPDMTKENSDFFTMVLGNTGLQAGAIIWVSLFLRRHDMTWAEAFGLRNGRWFSNTFVAVAAFLLFLPLAWALQQLSALALTRINVEAPPQQVVQILQGELPAWRRIYYGFAAVVLAPVIEELLFRGILVPFFRDRGWFRMAIWGTAVIFGLSHFNKISFIPLTLFGALLAWVYVRSGNLLVPIATHCLFNLTNFFFIWFQTQIVEWWKRFELL